MTRFAVGARRLPPHHVTIRAARHDGGWTGCVCARPLENTNCLILFRIGEGRRDRPRTEFARIPSKPATADGNGSQTQRRVRETSLHYS